MNIQLVNSLAQIINSLTAEERKSLEAQLNKTRSEASEALDINEEPFVGMWSDRQDLKDSGQWVKKMRQNEWLIKNE